jgi:splicing factor 1
MWRPATRQITGTNDVPLGQRRRFGPAPAEETAPPQLAQPSPSAYPRSSNQDNESPGKRGREESPSNGDPKGKLAIINTRSLWAPLARCCLA